MFGPWQVSCLDFSTIVPVLKIHGRVVYCGEHCLWSDFLVESYFFSPTVLCIRPTTHLIRRFYSFCYWSFMINGQLCFVLKEVAWWIDILVCHSTQI